jgi:hypothetical protein
MWLTRPVYTLMTVKAHWSGGTSVRFIYQYHPRKYSMNFDGIGQWSLHEELPNFFNLFIRTLLVDKIDSIIIIHYTEHL